MEVIISNLQNKKRYTEYFWLPQIFLPFCQKCPYKICEALSAKSNDTKNCEKMKGQKTFVLCLYVVIKWDRIR